MHSWNHNPFVNFLDIQVWFYLKLLIMSGLEGWWSISPTACLYSPRLTPRFIAEFYKARANAYRLYDSGFDAIEISHFARSYFARTENIGRRDIEVEGWLVHSFSSIFENGKYLADATVYRGSEKTGISTPTGPTDQSRKPIERYA